jgi:hypothetical protein
LSCASSCVFSQNAFLGDSTFAFWDIRFIKYIKGETMDKDSEFTTDTIAKYLIELKCITKVANLLNMSIGAINEHKRRYEQKHGTKIQCESRRSQRIKELSEERRFRSLLPTDNPNRN